MDYSNALDHLGVPRATSVIALHTGNHQLALDIAEGNYKNLAKKYHPDNPDTGNEEYMRTISGAIEELRDPDKLEMYLHEHARIPSYAKGNDRRIKELITGIHEGKPEVM